MNEEVEYVTRHITEAEKEENAKLEAELRQIMAEVMQPYNSHINALIKQVDHLTGLVKMLVGEEQYKILTEEFYGTKSGV